MKIFSLKGLEDYREHWENADTRYNNIEAIVKILNTIHKEILKRRFGV